MYSFSRLIRNFLFHQICIVLISLMYNSFIDYIDWQLTHNDWTQNGQQCQNRDLLSNEHIRDLGRCLTENELNGRSSQWIEGDKLKQILDTGDVRTLWTCYPDSLQFAAPEIDLTHLSQEEVDSYRPDCFDILVTKISAGTYIYCKMKDKFGIFALTIEFTIDHDLDDKWMDKHDFIAEVKIPSHQDADESDNIYYLEISSGKKQIIPGEMKYQNARSEKIKIIKTQQTLVDNPMQDCKDTLLRLPRPVVGLEEVGLRCYLVVESEERFFKMQRKLNEGQVYKVFDEKERQVRILKLTRRPEAEMAFIAQKEGIISWYISHADYSDAQILIMEYLEQGDLIRFAIENSGQFKQLFPSDKEIEDWLMGCSVDIINQLQHLRQKKINILHSDVRAANIIVKEKQSKYRCELIDFDHAKYITDIELDSIDRVTRFLERGSNARPIQYEWYFHPASRPKLMQHTRASKEADIFLTEDFDVTAAFIYVHRKIFPKGRDPGFSGDKALIHLSYTHKNFKIPNDYWQHVKNWYKSFELHLTKYHLAIRDEALKADWHPKTFEAVLVRQCWIAVFNALPHLIKGENESRLKKVSYLEQMKNDIIHVRSTY